MKKLLWLCFLFTVVWLAGCTEKVTLLGLPTLTAVPTAAAQAETDSTQQAALFWQMEELLFGVEGEFPLIPIFLRANYVAQHTWLTHPAASGWPHQWYDWMIDTGLQAAARRN